MATSAEIQALTAQIQSLTASMQKLVQAQSNVIRDVNVYSEKVDAASEELDDLRERFKKQKNATVEQEKAQRRLIKAKEDEIAQLKILKQEQTKLAQLRKNRANMDATLYNEQAAQIRANINNARGNINRSKAEVNKQSQILNQLGNSAGKVTDRFYFLVSILGKVSGSLLNFNKTFMDATAASAGVIEETTGNFDQGMGHWLMSLNATGVASKTVLEVMAKNRQMVNAMGGMVNTVKAVEGAMLDTRGLYGSQEEALRQNIGILSEFANKGVTPSIDALNAYNKDLDMMARMTGLSGSEMNAMINEISSDIDSMALLRAARTDEREAILANQRALLQNNIALGMTAKQAAEASKMLNKMVAQKPLERLKQAARMRAIGAAMGLGAESNAAAAEMMKPKGQQNLEIINAFNVALAKQSGAAAQQGIIPEIQSSILVEKLGFEEVVQTFDTNLGKTNQSLLHLRNDYKSSSDSTIVAINYVADIAFAIWNSLTDGTAIWGAILDFTRLIATIPDGLTALGTTILGGLASVNEWMIDKINAITPSWLPKLEKPESFKSEDFGKLLTKQVDSINATTKEDKKDLIAEAKTKREQADKEIKTRQELQLKPTANPVKVEIAPTQQSKEEATADKAESLMTSQVGLVSEQNTKIDMQLKAMSESNNYLKVIAETSPKLLDMAEKQLAVSTMTEEQRTRVANNLRSQDAKFSANYNYAI